MSFTFKQLHFGMFDLFVISGQIKKILAGQVCKRISGQLKENMQIRLKIMVKIAMYFVVQDRCNLLGQLYVLNHIQI